MEVDARASGSGRRAQAALEFMAMAAVAGMVLAIAAVIAFDYASYAEAEKRTVSGDGLCLLLGREVNVAAAVGQGYERAFYLPLSMVQFEYVVSFDNDERRVEVGWQGGGCFQPLLVNVSGVLAPGWNRLQVQNGVVVLN